ncbi:hypothetical protein LQV05_006242 [Cryptococcus neoformans]|nr:hypothetical protein J007_04840 [Cryptococcus neoformans var. grubii]OXC59634.1 hypothetical protein C358_04956 [Cryptococcus neoformans var. grubii MW-RSA852]UOH83512.1 hypothetical protein LQV05_006242 [Cryptococcus neoformans]
MDQPSGSSSSRHLPFGGPGARTILDDELGPSSLPDSQGYSENQYESHPVGARQLSQQSRDTPTASPSLEGASIKRVGGKANVSSACGPCKRAHLACDIGRPCKRCINMGKQNQCEDVPHKKRGRPKVARPPLGEPYHRTSRPVPVASDASGIGRWRGPSVYDPPFMPNMDAAPAPSMTGRISPPRASSSSMDASAANYPTPDPTAHPFTLFTTTDFKILRASPSCFSLVGYHPNEFVNLNLLDWIHPQDRHLIDMERNKLLAVPYVEGQLRSVEVTQAAITQRTELELLSPAEGMREPYPNKNVRVLHVDNRFSPFNVRLHLGGGLGASLWQPVTLGRVYLVVSFLAIPRSHHFPPDIPPVRRVSQISPPTPITPAPAMSGQGLPGFSSIAAGVDGPQSRYDQPPPQVYYPQPQPPTARPPPPFTAQPYPSYPQTAMPANAPMYPPRRSSSPNSAYRTPQTTSYPISSTEYQMQPGFYPPAGPPPLGPPTAIAGAEYRRSSYEEWRMAQQASTSATLPPPRDHAAVAGGSSGDGTRRTWEL